MSSVQAFCIRQDFRGGMAFKHIRSKTAHAGLDLEQAHRPVIQEESARAQKSLLRRAASNASAFRLSAFSATRNIRPLAAEQSFLESSPHAGD